MCSFFGPNREGNQDGVFKLTENESTGLLVLLDFEEHSICGTFQLLPSSMKPNECHTVLGDAQNLIGHVIT